MNKRQTLFALVVLGATPLAARAQKSRTFRVGQLAAGGRTPDGLPPKPFRDAMQQLGYVEGKNVVYEARFAAGKVDQLPGLAAELIGLKVDVIVTQGWPATMAAKQATSTLPLVMAPAAGDAVAGGLIASLARPGGNITGLSDESISLSAKRMEILTETVPKAATIAVIWNANDEGMTLRYREIEKAARILKVEVQAFGVRQPDDFGTVFSTLAQRRPDAVFMVADNLTIANRKQLSEHAAKLRLPAMYEFSMFVRDAGGLMSYGPNPVAQFQRAAYYVDRILKGAKPADLPVEQPTRYELVINLETAKTLGLAIPQTVLLRADEVIKNP